MLHPLLPLGLEGIEFGALLLGEHGIHVGLPLFVGRLEVFAPGFPFSAGNLHFFGEGFVDGLDPFGLFGRELQEGGQALGLLLTRSAGSRSAARWARRLPAASTQSRERGWL